MIPCFKIHIILNRLQLEEKKRKHKNNIIIMGSSSSSRITVSVLSC